MATVSNFHANLGNFSFSIDLKVIFCDIRLGLHPTTTLCHDISYLLPQLCRKIATEVDAAFRTPKNPYENLMRKIFSHMPL